MSTIYALLFNAAPSEFGWNGYSGMSDEVKEQVSQLTDASLLDLAEQCTNIEGMQVVIYETEAHKTSGLPPYVQSRVQMVAPLAERTREAVEAIYKADGAAVVLVFLKPNPLFSVAYIHRTMELLHLEDDVIITAMDEDDSLGFIATRTFHSCAYGSIRSLTEAGAFVVPLPSLKSISGMADLAYLSHEIERKVLLAQPVPRRTLEALNRMRRHNLIPEES